jgi:hypothetical protein
VRGAAVWALSRLLSAAAVEALHATSTESDPLVLEEWRLPVALNYSKAS